MAEPTPTPTSQPTTPTSFLLASHDTALALIPPHTSWPRLDRLRSLYDKAFPKWPPHVNLVYPFVRPDLLPDAVEHIAAALSSSSASYSQPDENEQDGGVDVCLSQTGVFPHKRDNTIYLCDADPDRRTRLAELRRAVLEALGAVDGRDGYKMHLTVAQSEDVGSAAHSFLLEKVGLMPRVAWRAAELTVLVRERLGQGQSVMRLWGTIKLADGTIERSNGLGTFYEEGAGALAMTPQNQGDGGGENGAEKDPLQTGLSYCFDDELLRWEPLRPSAADTDEEERTTLAVASYNVLAEFDWPSSTARYHLLVNNLLDESADADVLVLQEVTDGFLSYLLTDESIRDAYPYCSHGPPDRDDIEPLPSFLNIVVLSKAAFTWEYVSFHRKHKGAMVARFDSIGRTQNDKCFPLIVAAVHLSQGLTDGAVAAKKTDIKRMTSYLSETYPGHPWILAGDFNLSTSSISVNSALEKKAISQLTAGYLKDVDELLAEAKLDDSWKTLVDDDDNEVEGEQGATWDPTKNGLAAALAGRGAATRPQRYDRILVRGEGVLEIAKFNMFGFPTQGSDAVASDHWGVRCIMRLHCFDNQTEKPSDEIAGLVVPVQIQKAPEHLAPAGSVKEALLRLNIIPSEEEAFKRKAALRLLKSVLLDSPTNEPVSARSHPSVVVVPVGSYALDVWTSSSDMDVLCIGPFSSSTFFALASQRLRKAATKGIRIIRRVRANTGTMLEIEVDGIKTDLQYCPATSVAERWPQVLRTPPSDPVWSLSAQTLSKLKAVRDMDYLRRSVPDLAAFRLAHRFLKTWAKSRGIYSARFGFLSGIQISLLLARVQKLVVRDSNNGHCNVEDLVATFFAHYAEFDWSTALAFDPLFHRQRLPYTRTAREPMAVLGYFPPALNTALAASVPSVKTLAAEFRRARDAIFSSPSSSPTTSTTIPAASTIETWADFLAPPGGSTAGAAADFLSAHRSYVRLDVQYWGLSQVRGAQLLGWLESRCVSLLVDLHRRAPGLHVRMWPARFVERQGRGEPGKDAQAAVAARAGEGKATAAVETGTTHDDDTREFRGCYLIGLDKADPATGREELQLALGALQTVLSRFETQMRGDDKYFDARTCWLGAAVVNRGELGALEVDAREWEEYTAGEEEEEDEEEDEEGDQGQQHTGEGLEGTGSNDESAAVTGKKDKRKKGPTARQLIFAADPSADTTKKLRAAADVMNRIRWDPELDSNNYVVGYVDRFTGPQERELEAWKSEQTDEEFIPQHRILYFRRKSDGRRVWDRRTRVDELFGNVP